MNDLITSAEAIPQEFIENYNKRQAILSDLKKQKARNQKIVERENKKIEKINKTVKTDNSRVATERIQQAEQAISAIESLEKGESQLVRSLRDGTLMEDMRDLEAEHNMKVQEAALRVLSKDNNEKIANMKKTITDEELDALLEDDALVAEVLPDEPNKAQKRLVVGTEGINLDVVDPVRYSRNAPTPDILQRNIAIKQKTGQVPTSAASPFMPTTRIEMQQLLLALNLNASNQMTSKETADLLKTLLTCNETQLQALYSNAKLPIALKIIIKRVLQDVKNGNTETVERLWDRIFGKTGMSDTVQAGTESASINSIIPGAPISREAYIFIKDTIIDK